MMNERNSPDPRLDAFLIEHRLAAPNESASWHPLTGGVSSDIWRVDLADRSLCVKRALSTLKVAAQWQAPVSRNAYEWAWMQFAAQHCPDNVPTPLAHDPALGVFAMSFLSPAEHPVWKQQLMAGQVEIETAKAVGHLIGSLHAASAESSELAKAFDTRENFHALRLDPYLIATSARHPALASRLEALARRTASVRTALVHGDVSPKNILIGPMGPVLLDAECAWFGDPAFDLAFCLNHLLLKCLVRPDQVDALIVSFKALTEAYFDEADWELRAGLEARAAALLPALLLARVDGKSPAEYLNDERLRDQVRRIAVPLLYEPVADLCQVAAAWVEGIGRHRLQR
ncbi:Methylthioribose kinase [Trinickia soli]|jgi:tRNA A-37 threonylcarbamoyl transferase component Bud32|uniref:Aminoglycoside phosphotransferase n=2 Tax=Trinickia soli TaxID=380675 RepID=A0A2N7W6I6_9BURK|nr:aminoglycoside phosphotransferase family protein [Paraburkholderia sp. T12-10]PMS25016.1 aminoglycoside phosphotransferase [Trinickia soli]CAB3647186.1 Methylthioribose kinase [Trinickia soli]